MKTQEENSNCFSCGYSKCISIYRLKDEKVYIDDKAQPIYVEEETKGFGTFVLPFNQGGFQFGAFDKPITGEIVERFLNEITNNPSIVKEQARLTRFENGQLSSVYGELPATYEEESKVLQEEGEEFYNDFNI